MKTNKPIQDKVNSVLNSADAINEVKVSPFFKDKTLDVLFSEKEMRHSGWSWFTTKLQLATLVSFLALNIYVFTQISSLSYDDRILEFADWHDLNTTDDNSLLTDTYED